MEHVDERALLRCERCAGLWLSRALFLDALIEPALQTALEAIDRSASSDVESATPLACPDCGARMNRGIYARTSGVTVDVCRSHGVWLDPSEISRIIAFANANQPVDPPPSSPPSATPKLPDAQELHAALFPHSPFWDRLERLAKLLMEDPTQWRRRRGW